MRSGQTFVRHPGVKTAMNYQKLLSRHCLHDTSYYSSMQFCLITLLITRVNWKVRSLSKK